MTEIIHADELPLFSADDFNKLVLKINSQGEFELKIRANRVNDEVIKQIADAGYFVYKKDDFIRTDPVNGIDSFVETYFINW